MEISRIYSNGMCSTLIKYVPVGTMGWLKTKNGEVRQTKLVKVVWCENTKKEIVPRCEWKVAGIKEHVFGTWNILPCGVIYKTEFLAQHGSAMKCHHEGIIAPTFSFNLYSVLVNKYGDFDINERFSCESTWKDVLSINTIAMEQDGTMPIKRKTPFCVEIDSDGVHAWIPSVDNGTRFLTQGAALASYKPKKSITFDDEDVVDDEPNEKTITLKVEVKESDFQMIKHMIKVVD